MAIKVEGSALEDIKTLLKRQNIDTDTLRIDAQVGWGGMSFILVLDGPKDDDVKEKIDGLTFVVEQDLVNLFGGFTIKSSRSGEMIRLMITPDKQIDGGGCSSCTSCG